jgi:hypothetical protein
VISVLFWFLHSTNRPLIMKVDDDVMLDARRIDQFLSLDPSSHCCLPEPPLQPAIWGIWGHILHNIPPQRSGRYAVSEDQFPGTAYPSYAMGGFYMFSRAAVTEMLGQYDAGSLVHLEDIAITGQLRERAGLGLVNAWTLILPWLGNTPIGDEQIGRSVVVYLQFVQGGQEGVEAMADWVWNKVWARNYTRIRGGGYHGEN